MTLVLTAAIVVDSYGKASYRKCLIYLDVIGRCLKLMELKMKQVLYVVRHCQAMGQEPDAPLTKTGQQQAIVLIDRLSHAGIQRIVASPFVRAYQSIVPLAEHLGLPIEVDPRLVERVLSPIPLDNWREQLAKTFVDLDLCFEGGESSRTAMMRSVAVVDEVMQQATSPAVIVTHGNLMTLILKYFNQRIGFTEWENLQNPDVYCVWFEDGRTGVERIGKTSITSV